LLLYCLSLLPHAEPEYLSLLGMKLLVGAFSSGFRLLVGLSRRANTMRRKGEHQSTHSQARNKDRHLHTRYKERRRSPAQKISGKQEEGETLLWKVMFFGNFHLLQEWGTVVISVRCFSIGRPIVASKSLSRGRPSQRTVIFSK
jgi:hypothetical protein